MDAVLTAEQRELWEAQPFVVNEGESREGAIGFHVRDFRYACQFAGLEPVPSEEALRALIEREHGSSDEGG